MSTNLTTIRARVRRYLNETTADRWTDSEIDAYINEAVQFLQSEISTADPDYFVRVETFTAASGVYQAAFPSDIWGKGLRSLYCYPSSTVATGTAYRVPPSQLEWVYDHIDYSASAPEGYTLHEGYLSWAPLLSENSTFRYIYAMKESTLTNDTDVLRAVKDEHTDIIALYAAILALERIGGDTKGYAGIIERRLNHLRNDITPMDPLVIPQWKVD